MFTSRYAMTDTSLSMDMLPEWKKLREAKLIDTPSYLAIIEYVEDKNISSRLARIEQTAQSPSSSVSRIWMYLLTLSATSVVKFSLAVIDQVFHASPTHCVYFAKPKIFLSVLSRNEYLNDKFVCWKCCKILSHLFTSKSIVQEVESIKDNNQGLSEILILNKNDNSKDDILSTLPDWRKEEDISKFIDFLLNHFIHLHIEAMLFSFQLILRDRKIREIFVKNDGIFRLRRILDDLDASVQVQYQTIFCFWLLSFDVKICSQMADVVTKIVILSSQTQKEKVIRISLATLRHLSQDNNNLEKMVDVKLGRYIKNWKERNWGDEDLISDLDYLEGVINKKISEMSSFDRFRSEVLSGELEWTPVHLSESFWRESIDRFSENSFEVIRVLGELLSRNDVSETTQAVACYDIGEFVRAHPRGRQIIAEIGAKPKVMKLMYDPQVSPEVQRQALLCTRKMMILNWEKSLVN